METGSTKIRGSNAKAHILIGLIDGLTIPFALVAGLTGVFKPTSDIFAACIAMTVAFALIMGISAYMTGKKYEPSPFNLSAALIITISYLVGGSFVAFPFLIFEDTKSAFSVSAVLTILALLLTGYYNSKVYNVNPAAGAIRAAFTALLAAAVAIGVGRLFR